MKNFYFILVLFVSVIIFASTTHAAIWFTGTIKSVLTKSDGTVEVVLTTNDATPVDKWGKLTGTEWKAMLAAVLTAKAGDLSVSMRKDLGLWDMVKIEE